MECNVMIGRAEPCKDSVGGIKSVYFIDYNTATYDTCTKTNGIITAFGEMLVLYKYDLKGSNLFNETSEGSRNNGTAFWKQEGDIRLKKQTSDLKDILDLLIIGRYHILVEDYNGNLRIAGLENGCDIFGKAQSGANLGEFNGAKVIFQGNEKKLATYMSSSILDDKINTYVVTDAASALGLKEWWEYNALNWQTIEDNWNLI